MIIMKKSIKRKCYNPCKNKHTAKVLYIQDYYEKRERLKNEEEENHINTLEKKEGEILYLDEDRQKTLDLFVKVLHSMRKESLR